MKIIITNDDGIHAKGLVALRESLPSSAEVLTIVPDRERSASSHSISLGKTLRIKKKRESNGDRVYVVNGTPVDCVKFAVNQITDFKPDLLISGINEGANTGISVYYSGTLAAAREGMINKIPSFAISLCGSQFKNFEAAQEIVRKMIPLYMEKKIPRQTLLNVNVPPVELKDVRGIKIAKQAVSRFVEEFIEEEDDQGEKSYSLAGQIELEEDSGLTDVDAINQMYIAVTPLRMEMTDTSALKAMQNLFV